MRHSTAPIDAVMSFALPSEWAVKWFAVRLSIAIPVPSRFFTATAAEMHVNAKK